MLGCRVCSLHTSATGLCSACCRICSLNSLSNLLFVVMVLPPSNTRLQKLISLRTNRGAVHLKLPLAFNAKGSNLVVGVDGSGMKVSNRGEWIRQKWAVRRGWIKVVVLGDVDGNIVDIRVGNEDVDERAAGRGMIRDNKKDIGKVLADGLHDCMATFDLCDEFGLETGEKIRENADESGLGRRPDEVRLYKNMGYKGWAKVKAYGKRWLATEGIFSASKRIMGECVNAHKKRNMYREARLKFWAYQQVKDAGAG